jgi:hypothetical protein
MEHVTGRNIEDIALAGFAKQRLDLSVPYTVSGLSGIPCGSGMMGEKESSLCPDARSR